MPPKKKCEKMLKRKGERTNEAIKPKKPCKNSNQNENKCLDEKTNMTKSSASKSVQNIDANYKRPEQLQASISISTGKLERSLRCASISFIFSLK